VLQLMQIRALPALLGAACLVALGGCSEREGGPIAVAAIGGPPGFVDPNRVPLDPPSAFLLEAAAQGLVRFDAAGEIEPALAQSWIVSDDGLRYTFRIRRTDWHGGGRVTAREVANRLRAAAAPGSRNPLKPILGLIDEIEPMTDEVLEIALKAPRPNFLQLLAQAELAILKDGIGTGPYRAARQGDGSMFLSLPPVEDGEADPAQPPIALRGERAALAVAHFGLDGADLVVGGTAGDLPIARAADPPNAALVFDPVGGLFGLVFERGEGALAQPAARRALGMAVDRDGIVAALAVPGLAPRASLLPAGLDEQPAAAEPDWAGAALAARRQEAARTLATLAGGDPIRVRVAMPAGPGYRLIFAYLRRDWRVIGVEAVAVAPGAPADLRFVDAVAPTTMATWYLRNFTCDRGRVCAPEADAALAAARTTQDRAERLDLIAKADRMLTEAAVFLPIAAPVRWSLVSPRLTGFRRNPFGRHSPVELIARRQ
jgi:oligopeptide transport system substrate-binding protein